MADSTEALIAGLRENDTRPYGRTRTVTAEELVDAAEQLDDPKLLAPALLDLMEAYEYGGEPTKSPVVFARVLKLWDSRPDEFGDWARHQVFWRFKWVASALRSTPDVPLEALRRWNTEMRDRYRAAGHDLQPYYAQQYELAAHTGRGREQAFELWATRPRARYSDCVACEIRNRALHHVAAGDDARALREWQPVFDEQHSCQEEPHASRAHALLPLLREGRLDEARSAHLAGYRHARGKPGMAEEVGLHVEFCALTGNEPRGLELLSENRDLFDGNGDPAARLEFLTGVEVLLGGLERAGHGGLTVSGPPGSGWTVDTLLERVRADAGALAARFDARNGTDAVGARRAARLARRPQPGEPLALGVRAVAGPAVTAAPVVRADAEPLPEDFTELVLRARELDLLSHPDADRLWNRVAELAGAEGHTHPESAELGPVERLRAELAEQRVGQLMEHADGPVDPAELGVVAELFEQAGMAGRVLVSRARAAVVNLREEGTRVDHEQLAAIRAEADRLLADGGPITAHDHLTVLHCQVYARHHELIAALPDPAPGVVEALDTAVAEYRAAAERGGLPQREAHARLYLADAAARGGELDRAAAELRDILAALEKYELPWRAPRVLGLLGQVLLQQGEPAEAVGVLHRALAEATRWGLQDFPYGPTQGILGQVCMMTGDLAGAARALSESAARLDRDGETADAAVARLQLSDVLRESGRTADAVSVLESVLLDAEVLDERVLAQTRLVLARGLSELGEHRDAAEEFLRLADTVAGWEDQDTHTMVACEATVALAEAGSLEAADAARERALAAHAVAPRADQVVGMLGAVARATMESRGAEGLDAALALLTLADTVRAEAERQGHPQTDWHQRGSVHYERARALAVVEQSEQALAEVELAIAAYESGGEDGETARAEAVRIAAILEGSRLGRRDSALARLDAAVRRCEQAGLEQAARVLAGLRESLAREPRG